MNLGPDSGEKFFITINLSVSLYQKLKSLEEGSRDSLGRSKSTLISVEKENLDLILPGFLMPGMNGTIIWRMLENQIREVSYEKTLY